MDNILLQISDLHVVVGEKPILRGINLILRQGEVHALMGPNGGGKSTLAKILAGHPAYEVTRGEVIFSGKNLLELEPEARSHAGLFMSFQYPLEIVGVSNRHFLYTAFNAQRKARGETSWSEADFDLLLDQKMAEMEIRPVFKERGINEGFSGGEKKKNEILQLAIFEPALAILDETDSGLDIDAMRTVARGVNQMRNEARGFLLITHYQRLLESIRPDVVHVLKEGVIVQSGGASLAPELEARGYA